MALKDNKFKLLQIAVHLNDFSEQNGRRSEASANDQPLTWEYSFECTFSLILHLTYCTSLKAIAWAVPKPDHTVL